MSTRTLRKSVVKSLTVEVDKCTPDAAREATESLMNNLMEWGDLAQPQPQAQAMQAVATESAAVLSGVKSSNAALQDVKTNAEKVIALTTQHLQKVADLSMGQFRVGMALMQKRHPAIDAFADVAQVMRARVASLALPTIAVMRERVRQESG